jgi:hypothetical protein
MQHLENAQPLTLQPINRGQYLPHGLAEVDHSARRICRRLPGAGAGHVSQFEI